MSEFPVQVTIKPPAQFSSAPWLNFQAQDVTELKEALKETFPTVDGDSLPELVAKAFQEYAAVLAVTLTDPSAPAAPQAALFASQGPSIQSSGPAPQWAGPVAAAAPSGPPAPQCAHFGSHGQMVYREGNGAKGPWKAWFCPAPKGDPSQCKAQFIR